MPEPIPIDVRKRVAQFMQDELETGFDESVLLMHADPEFHDVFAVRFVVEPTADLENGPHPDDIGYNMDFLVVLDKGNPRYGVEEVEWNEWPPSQAKSLNPFNV